MGEKGIVGSTIFRGVEGWRRRFRDRGVMVCSCGGAIKQCVSVVSKAAKGVDCEGEEHNVLEE